MLSVLLKNQQQIADRVRQRVGNRFATFILVAGEGRHQRDGRPVIIGHICSKRPFEVFIYR